MFAALVDSNLVLWWVAVASTATTVIAFRAAWFGVVPKVAGMLGASAFGCVATSYWLDILDLGGIGPLDMRRGAGLVLWPATGWVVICLIRKSTKVVE